MKADNTIRLNKYISDSGICSRRQADRYIEMGQVFVNGKRVPVGTQVSLKDRVMVNGQVIEPQEEEAAIYIAFNKPVGVTTTSESWVKDNIVDYINHSQRIFPIGRLDKDSQGLIFLTSNGDMVNKILRAGNKHEKEYIVTVDKPVTDSFIEGMSNGVPILGVNTRKCFVKKEGPNVFRIILMQGLNRQIRRMCEHFGYEVTRLERIRIMNISLKGLALGEWRDFTEEELKEMRRLTAGSKGTAEAKHAEEKPAQKTRSKKAEFSDVRQSRAAGQPAKKPSTRFGASAWNSGKKKSSGGSKSQGKSTARKTGGRGRGR
jgi:23S rRNA pseudouridine2604 synthase